ncbi:MAG: hypothetical protein BIP78_1635 [Candidatus Bipolaricaulis sibiricus]|uniref:Uncharacterized protein n=1 Tax=Bipolaricaulis sibiricus TaxID=2501609 RepID=A0A410FWE7_BIPS1|nr:MAG: hypothetical protein BIP78_1635 [Candidatus Bipolaricaulis sibiricus]
MTGSWKHINCQKPFFDVALENLIKAYVIARHKIGLLGKMNKGITTSRGGEENDG